MGEKNETDIGSTIWLYVARYFGTCQTNMSSAGFLQEYYYGLSTYGFQAQFPYPYHTTQTHLKGCCEFSFICHLCIHLKYFLFLMRQSSALGTIDSAIEKHALKLSELTICGW